MDNTKQAIVYWQNRYDASKKGNGEPIPLENAKAAVLMGNIDFPNIKHWYEVIKQLNEKE